jgi:hypothetical protein
MSPTKLLKRQYARVLAAALSKMNSSIRPVLLSEIALDESGRVSVRTEPAMPDVFHMIYRAGRDVAWSEESQSIVGPNPQLLSQYQAFKEIKFAALAEHNIELRISPATRWSGISLELQGQIEWWSSSPYSDTYIVEALNLRGYALTECLLIGSPPRAFYWTGRTGLSKLFDEQSELAAELVDFLLRSGARRFESERDVRRAYGFLPLTTPE